MTTLTLVLPGLPGDWPDALNKEDLPDLAALAAWMGQGNFAALPPDQGAEIPLRWMAAHLGWPEAERLPVARLRLLGEKKGSTGAFSPREGTWLCADPVTLKAEPDHALVFGAGFHQASREESDKLAEALKAHFAPDCWSFLHPAPDRWYLRLPNPVDIACTPLWYALRRNAAPLLPRPANGPDAGERFAPRRWLTEMEMLLYNHPINAARAREGQPQINSVWLHGEGGWPDFCCQKPVCDLLLTDDTLMKGVARWADLPTRPLSALENGGADEAGRLVIIETQSWWANLQGDIHGWRDRLQELAALIGREDIAGRFETIRIATLGGTHEYRPGHRWRFWRKPWQFPDVVRLAQIGQTGDEPRS